MLNAVNYISDDLTTDQAVASLNLADVTILNPYHIDSQQVKGFVFCIMFQFMDFYCLF